MKRGSQVKGRNPIHMWLRGFFTSPNLRNYRGPTTITELSQKHQLAINPQEINSRLDESQKYTHYLAPGISRCSNGYKCSSCRKRFSLLHCFSFSFWYKKQITMMSVRCASASIVAPGNQGSFLLDYLFGVLPWCVVRCSFALLYRGVVCLFCSPLQTHWSIYCRATEDSTFSPPLRRVVEIDVLI